jgi:hypothetical protein
MEYSMRALVAAVFVLLVSSSAFADYRPQSIQSSVSGASVSGGLPCWDGTTGTILKDCTDITPPVTIGDATPGELIIDPSKSLESAIKYVSIAAGEVSTTPTDTNQMALVWFRHEGALRGPGLNKSIGLFEADYNDTATTVNDDSFTAVTGNCNLLGVRANTATQRLGAACIGMVAAARGVAHQGGAAGTEQGEIHALNIIAGLSDISGSAPHDYYDVIGAEVNMTGYTGGTMLIRYGFNSIDFGNGGSGDSEQGSRSDAAYNIAGVAGTKGWKTGINFAGDPTYGGNALSATGTVLGSDAVTPTTAAAGIDLSNFSISGNAFEGPSGLFVVSGAGMLGAQTITAQVGFISNAATGSGAVIDFSEANTVRWRVGRQATTQDFVIQDVTNADINVRITAAGVTSIGSTNPITISEPGVLNVPGGMTGTTVSTTGAHTALNATAIPAGGTAGSGYMFSSTANYGVFFGSGAPTLSAAQGSIYLRSDGSSTSTRAYINSDGGTTWVAVTTAS